ncbi:MAG: dihydrofolate reductase [Mycobacterium sp.]|jgi:dihydrofolate reductase|nr:dihydrofolate reductase [Mycobacterium sp.]
MHVTLDGMVEREDPNGATDWIGNSPDAFDFDLFDRVDACVLGRVMYPEYADYWRTIVADPNGTLAATGTAPTPEEIRYAEFANRTPHYVLTRTLTEFDWPVARPAADLGAVAALRDEPGADIYVVGGARTVSGLLDAGLIDELRLTVHPVILGGGTSLFGGVSGERRFELADTHSLSDGSTRMVYRTAA